MGLGPGVVLIFFLNGKELPSQGRWAGSRKEGDGRGREGSSLERKGESGVQSHGVGGEGTCPHHQDRRES